LFPLFDVSSCFFIIDTDIVTAVVWTPDGQLITCSDDKDIIQWTADGEKPTKITSLNNLFVTCIAWFPATGGGGSGKQLIPDTFAIACTDGTYRFLSRSGREEKKVSAHEGAIILLRWSHDGAALLTAGEDGDVKLWSKSGNLRSTVMSLGHSVYCAGWGPSDDQVIVGHAKSLIIKNINSSKKDLSWNAHDGIITCLDWNVSNGNIVSGSEDCTYKVWDSYGRQLYSSRPMEHVITSIAWSPNGESFAVGSYNLIRLCDRVGWTHCRERMKSGSIFSIQWTSDGTQFAAAGGNGNIVFSQIIDRKFEWKNYEVTLTGSRKIRVQDVSHEIIEDIELSKDRIVEIGLGYEQLIVTTTSQCYIYSFSNLNTPIIIDIKAPSMFIHLCRRHFLLCDRISGLQVISYEGRVLSSPKYPNLRPEFLTKDMISLSSDTLVVIDCVDQKSVYMFDSTSGRIIGKFTNHLTNSLVEFSSICLNQLNYGVQERIAVFSDKNHDLFVAQLYASGGGVNSNKEGMLNIPIYKLHSHVESFAFNDETNALIGLADGRMIFWYHPEIAFIDRDLLTSVTSSLDASEYGRNAQILAFTANRVTIRKIDGSIVYIGSSIDIPLLDELTRQGKWEESRRLCRLQNSDFLWASLASMALYKKDLETAEIALAELAEVPKVILLSSLIIGFLFFLIFCVVLCRLNIFNIFERFHQKKVVKQHLLYIVVNQKKLKRY
jgi:intraflagellar transport protein 80